MQLLDVCPFSKTPVSCRTVDLGVDLGPLDMALTSGE